MMSSKVAGYFLFALLIGAVLLSLLILGVQWVRSSANAPKAVGNVLYYEAPVVAQVAYYSLSEVRFEV
ncbi:MAG: hypothetical protein WCS37_21280 [Chloroflexota bacterium]